MNFSELQRRSVFLLFENTAKIRHVSVTARLCHVVDFIVGVDQQMFGKRDSLLNEILERRDAVTLAEQVRKIKFIYIKLFAQLVYRFDGSIIVVKIALYFGIRLAAFHGARGVFGKTQNVGDNDIEKLFIYGDALDVALVFFGEKLVEIKEYRVVMRFGGQYGVFAAAWTDWKCL